MKKIRIPLMVAATFAALALTTAANAQYKPAGDDGIAASPKVRQMLNERKASAAPVVVVEPAMPCPKCADVFTTEVNRQAKGGQFLAGTATQKVAKHTCTACQVTWTTMGEGKAKHAVATHKCTADVPNPATCCASN
jgi:hypothetical protein